MVAHEAAGLSMTFGVTKPALEALTWGEGIFVVLLTTFTYSTMQSNLTRSKIFYESSVLEDHEDRQ